MLQSAIMTTTNVNLYIVGTLLSTTGIYKELKYEEELNDKLFWKNYNKMKVPWEEFRDHLV